MPLIATKSAFITFLKGSILSPKFREEEGKLMITAGPFMDFSWKTYKVEYRKEEKELEMPYPGLKKFMLEREKRDLTIGKGFNKNYFMDDLLGEIEDER